MFHFDTDYMEGAHPDVMQRLIDTNLEQTSGYGTDSYCDEARQLIRQACCDESLDVYFLVGGTQTNSTIIDALLSHHEGVVAAQTGHINVHESGAIETFGHKVLTLPSHEGKVDVLELKQFIADFYADETYEHMVAPGMLYISYPTEYGTIYTKAELQQLHSVCQKANIPMFIDGARLGYGLTSDAADITLPELATLCDVFYIGGTKVGALFGECVVAHQGLLQHFTPLVKQHGALLANPPDGARRRLRKLRALRLPCRASRLRTRGRQPLFPHRTSCRRTGHIAEKRIYRQRVHSFHRLTH